MYTKVTIQINRMKLNQSLPGMKELYLKTCGKIRRHPSDHFLESCCFGNLLLKVPTGNPGP